MLNAVVIEAGSVTLGWKGPMIVQIIKAGQGKPGRVQTDGGLPL